MAQALLVFVHGTWSSPKIWPRLREHLRSHLGQHFPIAFESVSWSGGNSAAARQEGVRKFAEVISNHDDQSVFVICHSHGANIVLEADKTIRDRISLLICLNAPILTTIKDDLPWPVWVLFVMFVILSFAVGVGAGVGLGLESKYLAVCVLFLVSLFFWAANSRWAFLLFLLFTVAVAYPLNKWIIHLPRFDFYLREGWLVLTVVALILVPTLTLYACWARRYAKSVNPQAVPGMTHIVAIDDEIFTLLGLALAVQRVIQFAMWPAKRLFNLPRLWVSLSVATVICIILGYFLPPVKNFGETYLPYVFVPLEISAAIGAALIFVKLLLFGIAYGWDMAGLSPDHAIYVSPGSFVQPTKLYTVQPETGPQLSISHTLECTRG